jgi:hypothetical protein
MSRKLTTEEFIEKAKTKHGNRYSYERTTYVDAKTSLTVTCKDHGDFSVSPDSHANRGSGCAKCKAVKVGNHNRGSAEAFIAKSKEVHGDKYNYSLVEYTKTHDHVRIICNEHGEFPCMPLNHQRGRGCPHCAKHGYSIGKPGYMYVLSDGTTTKVGITNRSAEQRTREIVRSSGLDFTKRFSMYFEDGKIAKDLEVATLSMLNDTYEQPNSVYDGSTESFINVDLTDLLNFINQRAS